MVAADAGRGTPPPFARDASDVVAELGSDAERGLTAAEVTARLAANGPNAIEAEAPPSFLVLALQELRNPMNPKPNARALKSGFWQTASRQRCCGG